VRFATVLRLIPCGSSSASLNYMLEFFDELPPSKGEDNSVSESMLILSVYPLILYPEEGFLAGPGFVSSVLFLAGAEITSYSS